MSETKRGCCGGATPEEAAAAEVCSLPPDDLQERLAMVRTGFAPRVLRRERLPDGRAWAFEAAMRPELERLVALERACCSGLAWSLREDGATTWLEVRGPGVDGLPGLDAGA